MSYQVNRFIKFSQNLFVVWVLIGATWGYFSPKVAASGSGNISVLPPGSNVEVLNIRVGNDGNYWYYVRPEVEGTPDGWIRSNLVSFKASSKSYATLTGNRGDKINVRSAPSLQSKILHYGLEGDLVMVSESYS